MGNEVWALAKSNGGGHFDRRLGDVFKLEGNRRERWMYERGDDTAYIE
jgi:hypothetical protein